MQKFERITGDVKRGLVYIRDTGITVSQVVSAISRGDSTADVLKAYPGLEVEDVIQALGFAVDDMLEATAVLAHDARKPLSIILGYAGILTEAEIGDGERIAFAGEILSQAENGADAWGDLSDAVQLRYGFRPIPTEPMKLQEVVEDAREMAQRRGGTIQADIKADLPSVQGSRGLARALLLLGTDTRIAFLKPEATITAEREGEQHIKVEIQRAFAEHPAVMPALDTFFVTSGTGLYVAARLIEQMGGTVTATADEDGMTFVMLIKV
ncbi:MAG: DUF433 domain-containing protein [Anaerolineae bacterium]|nr:DUF433 domain-containing protein [Anaerolineae bacterium]